MQAGPLHFGSPIIAAWQRQTYISIQNNAMKLNTHHNRYYNVIFIIMKALISVVDRYWTWRVLFLFFVTLHHCLYINRVTVKFMNNNNKFSQIIIVESNWDGSLYMMTKKQLCMSMTVKNRILLLAAHWLVGGGGASQLFVLCCQLLLCQCRDCSVARRTQITTTLQSTLT